MVHRRDRRAAPRAAAEAAAGAGGAHGHSGALYSRLAELIVEIPPLRERREDILLHLASALGTDTPPLSADLAEALLLYRWPFNVREVVKIARALSVRGASAPLLTLQMVQKRLEAFADEPVLDEEVVERRSAKPRRAELEALLREHEGVVAGVARATGRSRKQVYRWLRQWELDPDVYR